MSGSFSGNESELLSSISARSPLITASFRQATDWKRRYLFHTGKAAAPTPAIYCWDEWLEKLSQKLDSLPVPLNRIQELLLWERVIRRDLNNRTGTQHISYKGLAKRATEAFSVMQEFRIDRQELNHGGEESMALLRWTDAIQAELRTGKLSGRCLKQELPSRLLPLLDKTSLPKQMMFTGFANFTPMQIALVNAMQELGCRIERIEPEATPAQPVVVTCADKKEEAINLAGSIENLLGENPESRIAILTSESSYDLQLLARKIDERLMPESHVNPCLENRSIAMQTQKLSDFPLVQQALDILSMAGEASLPFERFSRLLFSPYLNGFSRERVERAKLDADLRRQNRHHINLARLSESDELDVLPALRSLLRIMQAWKRDSRPASEWVRSIHGLLSETGLIQAGLEHQEERSDHEVAAMNKFRDILTSLAAADTVHGPMPWSRFISLLRSACSESSFSTPALFPNITVLPLADITGLRFDHIFVLGLDEQAFPPPARPQPLLPLSLQREYGLPESSGALQFEACERLWQQLLRAAPHIEISYACSSDEREMLPSPFIRDLKRQEPHPDRLLSYPEAMTEYEGSVTIPLQSGEEIRGGTAILKDQSDCPFRAFVAHRLHIASLGETAPGIEATTKGSLLHKALEFIWKHLQSQRALLALSDADRQSLINEAVEHAWSQRDRSSSPEQSPTQKFEKKRMQRVLAEWLELEKRRPPFEVTRTEQRFDLQLPERGNRTVALRISADRIDRDHTGRTILIDYKTGRKQSSGMWLGDRMEQPQLPLYAMAAGLGEDDAVAYATVRSGDDMGFEGLAGEDIGIPGINPCDGKYKRPDDWNTLLESWRDSINGLAGEFVDGRNEVAPRDNKACNYCTFEAICRVEESGFVIDSEDES